MIDGISNILKGRTFQKQSPQDKIEFEFQEIGVDMEKHFGKEYKSKIWSIFHKVEYPIGTIRDSWTAYQSHKDKPFKYFMAILNNKAGKKKKDAKL